MTPCQLHRCLPADKHPLGSAAASPDHALLSCELMQGQSEIVLERKWNTALPGMHQMLGEANVKHIIWTGSCNLACASATKQSTLCSCRPAYSRTARADRWFVIVHL